MISMSSSGLLSSGSVPRYYHPVVHVNASAQEYPSPDMALEAGDELQCNVIVLQLLAFGTAPQKVSHVHFCINMYNFAEYCTAPLVLVRSEDGEAVLEMTSSSLAANSSSSSALYVKPSSPSKPVRASDDANKTLTLSFCVPANSNLAQKNAVNGGQQVQDDETSCATHADTAQFAQYLESGSLDIAAFDSRTKLPLGSARIALRPLLRQGRRGVQFMAEYELADALAEPFLTGPVSAVETKLGAVAAVQESFSRAKHGRPSIVVRMLNFGASQSGSDAEVQAHQTHTANAVQPMFSSVMRNAKDMSAAVDRKAAVLWRSLALVVCRHHELMAHLRQGRGSSEMATCTAKELEDAIFATGLPLTLHQASQVASYLAREFGLVDALGNTGRGGIGGLIDLSRIEPAFVGMVRANASMLESCASQVEEVAGALLQYMAARYGSLDRAWTLISNDASISRSDIQDLILKTDHSHGRCHSGVCDDIFFCLGSRAGSAVGEQEFNRFFDIHVRGRASDTSDKGKSQEKNRKLLRWQRTERVREKCLFVTQSDTGVRESSSSHPKPEIQLIQERLQLLEAARAMRDRHKSQRIAELLHQVAGRSHRICVQAPFGETRYVPHAISNPFLQPRMLQITCADAQVSLVSDEVEMAWVRRCIWLHETGADVRSSWSSIGGGDAEFELAEVATRSQDGWQVLVGGGAKVTVVLKLRCIGSAPAGPRAVLGLPPLSGATPTAPWCVPAQGNPHAGEGSSVRTAVVNVVAKKHEQPDESVERVHVRITALPPMVDRTWRFYNGSNEQFERNILMAFSGRPVCGQSVHSLPDWRSPLSAARVRGMDVRGHDSGNTIVAGAGMSGSAPQTSFSAWCSDESAAVGALTRRDGLSELHLLRAGRPAGEADSFLLVVYSDAFQSSVVAVFKCHVSYFTRLPLKGWSSPSLRSCTRPW